MRYFEFGLQIDEDIRRRTKGEVPFRASSLIDPHIQKVIQQLSSDTGVSINDITKQVSEKIDEFKELQKYSPMLHDTLILNAAENAVFKLIRTSKIKIDPELTKFNPRIFKKLLKIINQEQMGVTGSKGIFPLRVPGETRVITSVDAILVPVEDNPDLEQFNDITTAAVTPKGQFIFNVPFMEQLLYYGAVVEIKPNGQKYISNGGIIPDNYCYIEFLILHELYHYMYGDFKFYEKYKKFGHTAHNIASDFRSNYILVKNGYTQLPIGLFSDDLNLDRDETNNYYKLLKIVDRELKKLPKRYQAWVENELSPDEHPKQEQEQEQEQEKVTWNPQVGDIVLNNLTGKFVKVTQVHDDGTADVEPASKEEVQSRYPGVKVG
jgi:hypothetical protein